MLAAAKQKALMAAAKDVTLKGIALHWDIYSHRMSDAESASTFAIAS